MPTAEQRDPDVPDYVRPLHPAGPWWGDLLLMGIGFVMCMFAGWIFSRGMNEQKG